MRITLDIDDDVLMAAEERARRERRSAGAVLSELARHALNTPVVDPKSGKYGFRPLPSRGGVVTNALIDELVAHLEP